MKKPSFYIPIEEKVRILSMHESATKNLYLLNEQKVEKIDSKQFILPNNTFSGGRYSNFNVEEVDNLIDDINQYIASIPKNKKIILEIVSSESKVTNYDREKYPVTGDVKVDYKDEKKLPAGMLSSLRAKTIEKYLRGKLPDNVEIIIKDLGAQGPNWVIPDGANIQDIRRLAADERYTKHQFVSFNVTVESEKTSESPICNLNQEASGGLASKDNDFVFVEKTVDISNLSDGQKIKFTFLPAEVPDMLVVVAGDKTYSTGFVGVSGQYWSIMLATILGNTYDGKPPLPFPQDIREIDSEYVLKNLVPNEGLEDILGHILKIDWKKNYEEQVKQIKWFNFGKNPITSDYKNPDFNGKYGGSIIVTKDSTMKTLTYRVYSPIGTTIWKLSARCI